MLPRALARAVKAKNFDGAPATYGPRCRRGVFKIIPRFNYIKCKSKKQKQKEVLKNEFLVRISCTLGALQ